MYKEHILELYRSPKNFGELKGKNREATEYNATCGDEITMQFNVKDNTVKGVKFSGSGCVISLVSASLLTDKMKNMNINKIKRLSEKDMIEIIGMKVNPGRIKCALLPLEAAKKALK